MANGGRNESPVFIASFILTFIALIFHVVAFCSPHWIQSWERTQSDFLRAGLWEFCFNAFTHPQDYLAKSYVGCWWVYSPEYFNIREFLMPPWFIAAQWLSVSALVLELLALCIQSIYYMRCCSTTLEVPSIYLSAFLMVCACIIEGMVVIVFGALSGDRTWMPRPDFNYLSWSYAFAVLSGFVACFAGCGLAMAGSKLSRMVKKDPNSFNMGTIPPPHM
ncbi:uncharacterized protein LOC106179632 [Lingula anatina]|uniref:Uncharacterized protein LOC106179632 n=1 Tax=Lingula anatina TaxID=7574 RepID=A0A1S3K847_LINAN|nr:uncharacterized protein LOC106179632 [Lingula anatina]|eukprot:XP_013418803.1 uncharacterized protein LOC106179632 [Lingula anatina]